MEMHNKLSSKISKEGGKTFFDGKELLHCEICDRNYTGEHSASACSMYVKISRDIKEEHENDKTLQFIPRSDGHGINRYDELNQSLKKQISEDEIRSLFNLRKTINTLDGDIHSLLKNGLSLEDLDNIVTDFTVINRWVEDFVRWRDSLEMQND